jgi:hypothetical protein
MVPSGTKQENDVTKLNEEVRDLAVEELDLVSGGLMGWDDVLIGIGIGLVELRTHM